jgi:hypothetical protein
LIDYPLFQRLNVTISEILSKQAVIKKMLANEEYAAHWKQNVEIPTEALEQSQE